MRLARIWQLRFICKYGLTFSTVEKSLTLQLEHLENVIHRDKRQSFSTANETKKELLSQLQNACKHYSNNSGFAGTELSLHKRTTMKLDPSNNDGLIRLV